MAGDVVHDFAAAGGMADMHGVLEVEMRRQRREVVGIVIHVVAAADLARAAVAAPVMGDDAEALAWKNSIWASQSSADKRPAMAEDDGLPRAPILVEDLDAVLGGNRAHLGDSLSSAVEPDGEFAAENSEGQAEESAGRPYP